MPRRLRFALLLLVIFALSPACAVASLDPHHRAPHGTPLARKEARVVRYARRLLGIRYRYGGVSPAGGFDCSGFTRFVYAHFGVALPHYSGGQFAVGRRVSRAGLRPGDLV